ncbi:MAG: prolipoprotein diacylglyceryl transferase [Lachnospiraceae bacterium]|nr:prolipoprotein diacylglyceryl transferase [Lachnospiraceae bacterium]
MRPILFSIGDVNIYSYGVAYATALVLGLLTAMRRAKKEGMNGDLIFNIGFYSIICGVLGAKLLYLITIADRLTADFWGTLKNSITTGFVVYGGILAAVLFAYFYIKKKKAGFLRCLDIAVISIALGQAIGRIGCLMAGCCHGIPTDAWHGITFPEGASEAPAGIPLVPVQIISSALNFINFGILIIAYNRFRYRGMTAALYMINYGVGRFIIEYFRADFRGTVGPFSTSQFISFFMVTGGVVLIIIAVKKRLPRPDGFLQSHKQPDIESAGTEDNPEEAED